MFSQPIARLVTRPGSGDLKDTVQMPDMMMCTLMSSARHLLNSNTVYELRMNNMTGVIELIEVGESCIGRKWGHNYYDIPIHYGKTCWLTKEELKEHSGKEYLG